MGATKSAAVGLVAAILAYAGIHVLNRGTDTSKTTPSTPRSGAPRPPTEEPNPFETAPPIIPGPGALWVPIGISPDAPGVPCRMFAAHTFSVGFVPDHLGWLFTPTPYGYYLIFDLDSQKYVGTMLY